MRERAAAAIFGQAPAAPPLVPRRRGIVHADGRNFADDGGLFYPFGATLFWALRGWKFERDRVKKNIAWLARWCDYIRILGEVGWAGNDIRPDTWPDYDQVFQELTDWAYDACGVRTGLTLLGGGTGTDPAAFAARVAGLVTNRPEKFIWLEPSNESFQNGPEAALLQRMIQILTGALPHLVGSSSEGTWAPDYVQAQIAAVQQWRARMGTAHLDRQEGDFGWRAVRQPWDWKDLSFPMSQNEPIGPRSSVAECTDALQLAMLRATGIVCGMGDFVLHNGAGVAGQVDPAHNRPANLWEVPGIEAIMETVKGVDRFLPPRAGDGRHWNNGWTGNPFVADAIWSDGADHGVNRCYLCETGAGFVQAVDGIKDHVVFASARAVRLAVSDPVLGTTEEMTCGAGQSITIRPKSLDHAGYGGLVIVATYV